jgi:hypothetical protein
MPTLEQLARQGIATILLHCGQIVQAQAEISRGVTYALEQFLQVR